jgi:hypothetical protein
VPQIRLTLNWPVDAHDRRGRLRKQLIQTLRDGLGLRTPVLRGKRKTGRNQPLTLRPAPSGYVKGLAGITRGAVGVELVKPARRGAGLIYEIAAAQGLSTTLG